MGLSRDLSLSKLSRLVAKGLSTTGVSLPKPFEMARLNRPHAIADHCTHERQGSLRQSLPPPVAMERPETQSTTLHLHRKAPTGSEPTKASDSAGSRSCNLPPNQVCLNSYRHQWRAHTLCLSYRTTRCTLWPIRWIA